jgi:hypothetical protein
MEKKEREKEQGDKDMKLERKKREDITAGIERDGERGREG